MNGEAIAIHRVIERLGGPSAAASALGLKTPSVIANWRSRNRIPAGHVLAVERVTGIPRHELRPDLYPQEGV